MEKCAQAATVQPLRLPRCRPPQIVVARGSGMARSRKRGNNAVGVREASRGAAARRRSASAV